MTFDITNCFEWGPGHSTEIFLKHRCTITSVESDPFYLGFVKRKFKVTGAEFMLEQDRRYYPYVRGNHAPYDLVFVDGRMRERCLMHAQTIMKPNGFVILHDAERRDYEPGKSMYPYQIHTDNGNTAVLTYDKSRATKIRQLLSTHSI